jgi:hypothetical protein
MAEKESHSLSRQSSLTNRLGFLGGYEDDCDLGSANLQSLLELNPVISVLVMSSTGHFDATLRVQPCESKGLRPDVREVRVSPGKSVIGN